MSLTTLTPDRIRNLALGGLALAMVAWGLSRYGQARSPAFQSAATVSQKKVTRYISERPITLPELLADPDLEKRFTPLPATTEPIGGNDLVNVWLRIPLDNPGTEPRHDIIEVKQHWTKIAQLYVPDEDGHHQLVEHAFSGKAGGLLEPYPVPAFPVILAPGTSKTFYLRLQNFHWLDPSIIIWSSPDEFIRQLRRDDRLINTYIGLMVGLFIANLCAYIAFRYRDLLYYLLYLISSFGLNALNYRLHSNSAWHLPFIIPDQYDAANIPPAFLGLLLLTSGLLLLFAGEFTDLRKLSAKAARAAHCLVVVLLAAAPLVMFGPASAAVNVLRVPIVVIWCLVNFTVLALGIHATWRRQRHAPWLVPAIALLCLVSLNLARLSFAGKPVTSALLEHWLFASCAEMVILAFGLIGRFLQVNRDRQTAQAETLREMEKNAALQNEFTRKLTAMVEDRTAELSTSNQQKERLITVLAHDMRTPLNSLVSVSGLLARTPHQFSHEQLRHFASEIEGNARGVSSLMENLLCWAQLENGQLTPVFQDYLLTDIFDEAISQVATQAGLKSIQLTRQAPRQLFVTCDFAGITAVVRNLLSNAVKFVPENGAVSLSGELVGETVQIEVLDNGMGLAPADVTAINRREKTDSRLGINGERGTGLGLLICHDLLRLHHSRLHVTSRPGATRFQFSVAGHVFQTPVPFAR